MLTGTALARLRDHEDTLAALLDECAALLAGAAAAVRAALARTRWSIARCARGYQLFKHVEIFAPSIARAAPARAAVAQAMQDACLAMSADYEAHLRRWSGRDPAAEWPAYRAETGAIVRRMRRHLVTERRQVERLLAGTERLRRAG